MASVKTLTIMAETPERRALLLPMRSTNTRDTTVATTFISPRKTVARAEPNSVQNPTSLKTSSA